MAIGLSRNWLFASFISVATGIGALSAPARAEDDTSSLKGKPAPAFPPRGQWLNSKPITWADFRGKVVIVDFFADWCGPCRNDYPALVQMNKDRENSGIYILGIHTPGSGKEAIEKLMKDYSITYPVFVDVPAPPGVQSWGTVYSAFGVTAIPHSFLIDPNGQVVSHGMLGEIVGKARELRNKTKKAG